MSRTKLIQLRRGTRAELNASTAAWAIGEPGYITDEGVIIVAKSDGNADEIEFKEIGGVVEQQAQGAIVVASGLDYPAELTLSPVVTSGYLAFLETKTNFAGEATDAIIGYGMEKVTKISPDSDFQTAQQEGTLTIIGWLLLEEIQTDGTNGMCAVENVVIRDCPELLIVNFSGGSSAGMNQATLAISNCPKLENLACINCPDIVTFALDSHPNLETVQLDGNGLTIAPILQILGALPDRTGKTAGAINLTGNPGVGGAGYAAAVSSVESTKNWTVTDGL